MSEEIEAEERERCKRDVCSACAGYALGYKRANGPNSGGNWTHVHKDSQTREVLCSASGIWSREAWIERGRPEPFSEEIVG